VALDADRAPLSDVAASDAAGSYALRVPAPRDATGRPVQTSLTLRADAQGYQTFPGGLRTALPIDLSTAVHHDAKHQWTVTGALTSLELLPDASGGTAWLRGTVVRPPGGVGALVVAETAPGGAGPGTGHSAIADAGGTYHVFNLAAASAYELRGYARGVNYAAATTGALAAGENVAPALVLAAGTGATISGGLIFNNGAASPVGVALVVESTYVPSLDRGETPPGLAVPSGASDYVVSGVPDGSYIVLAAYGIDGAVRDISGGGNTAPARVVVQGGVAGISPAFKVKPAVSLTGIDGQPVTVTPVAVTSATPAFTWAKASAYSSASTYRVKVYDAFGVETWSHDQAAGNTNTATYAGAPLQPGMPYQLRILALAEAMPVPSAPTVLSQTEDLLGVFTLAP
jgi:hypothetical protein